MFICLCVCALNSIKGFYSQRVFCSVEHCSQCRYIWQLASTPDCKCVENWVKSLSIPAFCYFLSLYLISLCHKQPTRTPRFMRSGGFSSCWRCAVWFCCCWWFLVSFCTDRTGSTRAVEQVTWTKPLQPSHDTSIHPPSIIIMCCKCTYIFIQINTSTHSGLPRCPANSD